MEPTPVAARQRQHFLDSVAVLEKRVRDLDDENATLHAHIAELEARLAEADERIAAWEAAADVLGPVIRS